MAVCGNIPSPLLIRDTKKPAPHASICTESCIDMQYWGVG